MSTKRAVSSMSSSPRNVHRESGNVFQQFHEARLSQSLIVSGYGMRILNEQSLEGPVGWTTRGVDELDKQLFF